MDLSKCHDVHPSNSRRDTVGDGTAASARRVPRSESPGETDTSAASTAERARALRAMRRGGAGGDRRE